MARRTIALALLIVLTIYYPARADPLPTVGQVDRGRLQAHCRDLLAALEKLKAPLPAETDKALRALLKDEEKDTVEFAEAVQKLLDPLCLAGVSINPESRVKAARGALAAELREGRETVVLVKVLNDGGVTAPLAVSGPQLRAAGEGGEGRWLEANTFAAPPLGKTLSGMRLEYVPLRLTGHEAGKREATLKFDVGQGTQDLGFRAEVPVLFSVRPASR